MAEKVRYVIKDREQSPLAEAFRALCACIQDTERLGKMQSVLFASASAGEGGTMTAVNTAAALSYAGKKIILVDCDLRHPILREGFGLKNLGLTDYIADQASLEEILQDSWIPNVKVVTSGPIPVGPISALSNEKTRDLLAQLRSQADFVILTSSPLLLRQDYVISDACVLASRVDGVVLVIDSQKIKPKTAQKVVQLLNGAKANIIGTVLNDVTGYSEVVYHAEPRQHFSR